MNSIHLPASSCPVSRRCGAVDLKLAVLLLLDRHIDAAQSDLRTLSVLREEIAAL